MSTSPMNDEDNLVVRLVEIDNDFVNQRTDDLLLQNHVGSRIIPDSPDISSQQIQFAKLVC